MFGGFDTTGVAPVASAYAYNVNTNTWTQKANLPEGVYFAKASGFEDSLIYIAGGIDLSADRTLEFIRPKVLLYNANLDAYRNATPMPEGRADGGFTLSVSYRKMYYFGGFNTSTTYSPRLYGGTIGSSDRAQIAWTWGADYPSGPIGRLNAHWWGQNSVIIGGGSNSGFTPTNNNYTYNVDNNSYTMQLMKPTSMTAYQSGVSVRLNTGKLVIAGGVSIGPSLSALTQIYTDVLSDVRIENTSTVPASYSLAQNFPNPFNPATTIAFDVQRSGNVTLSVYGVMGQLVTTLVDQPMSAGSYEVRWNAPTQPSGVYFYRLDAGGFTQTRKMLLTK